MFSSLIRFRSDAPVGFFPVTISIFPIHAGTLQKHARQASLDIFSGSHFECSVFAAVRTPHERFRSPLQHGAPKHTRKLHWNSLPGHCTQVGTSSVFHNSCGQPGASVRRVKRIRVILIWFCAVSAPEQRWGSEPSSRNRVRQQARLLGTPSNTEQ